MTRFLLTTAALIAGTVSALAADMTPAQRAAAEKAYAADTHWGGFYFGAHGGWAKLNADPINVSTDGFIWGGHAGVNFQKGVFVGGLEMAVTQYDGATKFGNSTTGCDCLVADLIAKAGVTVAPNLLVYLAGGGFWHNAQTFNVVPSFGWTAGGGADWLPFGDHLVIGMRYLYRDLETQNHPISITGHEFTGRISYKF